MPDHVLGGRATAEPRRHCEVGHVADRHGLHSIPAVTRDSIDGQAAQQPGHVVDEDLLAPAEHERRADHGVLWRRLGEDALDRRLASEVGEWRARRGIRDQRCTIRPTPTRRAAARGRGCSRPRRRSSRRRGRSGSSRC